MLQLGDPGGLEVGLDLGGGAAGGAVHIRTYDSYVVIIMCVK